MPEQTIQFDASWYLVLLKRWAAPIGSRPAIDAALRGADDRFFASISLSSAGQIYLRFASSQTENATDADDDLSSAFEQSGSLEFIVGGNSLLITLDSADLTEPYLWFPSNGAEVTAFEALLSDMAGAESGQLIIRDFVPTLGPVDHAVDAGDVAWAFDLPQPTVTYTPAVAPPLALATSDWNSAGYQAPIVLALLEATISGADITVDPVTAVAGDLVVASDLTIAGVERHPSEDSIRLRRTGSGGFSFYFDNEGTPLYPAAKAFIVIDDTARTHIPFSIGSTGGGFNNWLYDTASQESLIEAIATGDRFLLAIAEPGTAPTDHAVDAGDVAWAFDLPQPTVTYTPAGTQAVDAGDVAWAFDLPQPTVTYTPAGTQAVDAGDVAWAFDIPQPTVTYTPAPSTLVRSAFAQETDGIWLILLTISHADLTDDIRVVHNQVDITSRGKNFVKFAFEISLPIDSPDRAPIAELRIDNVSREIAQAVRSIMSAPTVTIEVIQAADPDTVELTLDGFRLRDVTWDANSVRGTLVLDDIATEPYPVGLFSPAGFPGLT